MVILLEVVATEEVEVLAPLTLEKVAMVATEGLGMQVALGLCALGTGVREDCSILYTCLNSLHPKEL